MGEIRKHGTAASPGIAIGRAYVLDRRRLKTPKKHVSPEEVEVEIARFGAAIKESDIQLERIKSKLVEREGEDHFRILEAHQLILHDEHLVDEAIKKIREEHINAEWALRRTVDQIKKIFDAIEDEYFRERRSDIDFVGDRILRNLLGEDEGPVQPPPDAVVVAHDLSPGDTAQLHRAAVAAIVTNVGGRTSHTAIIARAHEIAGVVGLEEITSHVTNGDLVIVDGTEGLVIINPEPQTVAHFRARARREAAIGEALLANRDLPTETLDGQAIHLYCNVDIIDEVPPAIHHGAEGIGLYRTEFLFLGRAEPPSEDEHYQHARAVLEQLGGKTATFRTFDLGGDKASPFAKSLGPELNPALGLRSIRLCLTPQGRPLFKAQLRGLLRASAHGPLRIMFPMISGVGELREAKAILEECKAELRARGEPFDPAIKVGMMIEMPSAALTSDLLAKEIDFFSIGTNDLIQYSLAIDRVNEHVGYLYEPLHPAILRIVRYVATAAKAHGIPVAMCGEMAGEPLLALVLVGLGLDELSMNAAAIPVVKAVLRASTMEEARTLADQALKLSTARAIEELIREHMAKRFPDEVLKVS
ncbi:MAG: phosphoenolpyruvate--protein phosphotransferase [Deltaproteobacteria bacterium]|nr:phosphoenolpyruvate--protein phosphotransferase [Deltaproteobacteria bacterium]